MALLALFALALLAIGGLFYYLSRAMDEEDDEESMRMLTLDHRVERQRRQTKDGHGFEVDNSPATFTLDLQPEAASTPQRLFPDHASAIAYARQQGLNILPSVGLVHDKCKKVNDRISQALETAMQADMPKDDLPGRRSALQQLAVALLMQLEQASAEHRPAFETALVYVAAALQAGGAEPPPDLSPDLTARAERAVEIFLADAIDSRPVGFWDQTPELTDLFRQDRFLATRGICLAKQTAAAVALAGTIVDDPQLRAAFERSARFGSSLTNPPSAYRFSPLRLTELAPPQQSWQERLSAERGQEIRKNLPVPPPFNTVSLALFAFASSPEETLWLKMPLGFTGAQLIAAIEQGIVDLEPADDSGWYDYQWFALETLVLPARGREDHKLETNRAYRDRLREIFLAAIARDRETQIKNLPCLKLLAAMSPNYESELKAEVGPLFAVEPLPTVYLRLARAYRFLKTAMASLIEERLHETMMADPLHGDGEQVAVAQALDRMAGLTYGLYELACRDLGLNPQYLEGEYDDQARAAAVLLAEGWLARLEDDPHLQEDTRVAVPLFVDPSGSVIISWACAGLRLESLVAEFDEIPRVYGVKPIWTPSHYWVASEVFLEFTHSGEPLTRDEFRALCDAHPDEASLRAALGAPPRSTRRAGWRRAVGWLLATSVLVSLIWLGRRMPRQKRKNIVRYSLLMILAIVVSALAFLATAHRLRTRIMVEHVLHRSRLLSALTAYYYMGRELDGSPRLLRGRVLGLLESMADARSAQARYLAVYLIDYLHCCEEVALALVEPEIALPLLLRAAEDQVPQVACSAILWLSFYDRPETVNLLQAKLRSPNTHPEVRLAAASAAGMLQAPELIDDLRQLLWHGSRYEQRYALESLIRYEDQRAHEALLTFLEEREHGKTAEEIEKDYLASRIRKKLFGEAK